MTSNISHDEGDDHYYVAGYSAEDDPYVYPNGVLINLLNIQDTATSELVPLLECALVKLKTKCHPASPSRAVVPRAVRGRC